ncbi:hypothetical protein DFP73DRAFT_566187 [Morchella snyderi]|nr:hypothetical protein DFP73DRAFT_566187 [Morchella snyderi]
MHHYWHWLLICHRCQGTPSPLVITDQDTPSPDDIFYDFMETHYQPKPFPTVSVVSCYLIPTIGNKPNPHSLLESIPSSVMDT